MKVLLIAVTTLVPIVLFLGTGEIAWAEGGVLALGSIAGGHAGAHFSNHPQAKKWAFRLLVVVILLEVVHLGWHYFAPLRAGGGATAAYVLIPSTMRASGAYAATRCIATPA